MESHDKSRGSSVPHQLGWQRSLAINKPLTMSGTGKAVITFISPKADIIPVCIGRPLKPGKPTVLFPRKSTKDKINFL